MPNSSITPLKTAWLRVMVLWFCGIAAGMQFAKVSVGFKSLLTMYGTDAAHMGFVMSSVGVAGLVLGVTVGLLAPMVGYRRLLLVGMLIGAVLAAAQVVVLPLPLLLATRLLEGLSHLSVVVAAPTLMVACAAPRHRAVVMGLWSTFFGVAFILTALLADAVLGRWHVTGLLFCHAVLMCLAGLGAWWVVPADGHASAHRVRPREFLSDLLRRHVQTYSELKTALPGLCFFCYTALSLALMTFVPQYTGLGWLSAVLPLLTLSGNFLAGGLVQYFGAPMRLLSISFVGMMLAGASMAVCHSLGVSIVLSAMAVLFLGGLAGGTAFTLIPVLSGDKTVQARANGAVAQMGNLGSSMGSPVFALAMASFGAMGLAVPVVILGAVGWFLAWLGARFLARHT